VSGEQIAVRLPTDDVEPQKAWTRDRISPDRWLIPVPPACVAELDQVVATLQTSRVLAGHQVEVQTQPAWVEGDQARIEQHLDVLAHGRLRQGQALGHVGAAAVGVLFGEDAQDRQAHRVAQRAHHVGKFLVLHRVHRHLPIEENGDRRKTGQFNCSERNEESSPTTGGGSTMTLG